MFLPDEVAAKAVVPALRASVACKLINFHGLTQIEAAKKLNITQAAISNYVRKTRGAALNLDGIKDVQQAISEIAILLTKDKINYKEILMKFSQVSEHIKSNRLMCDYHMQLEPDIDLDDCDACDPNHLVQIRQDTQS